MAARKKQTAPPEQTLSSEVGIADTKAENIPADNVCSAEIPTYNENNAVSEAAEAFLSEKADKQPDCDKTAPKDADAVQTEELSTVTDTDGEPAKPILPEGEAIDPTLPEDALSAPEEPATENIPPDGAHDINEDSAKDAHNEEQVSPSEHGSVEEQTKTEQEASPLPHREQKPLKNDKDNGKDKNERRLIDGIFDFIELFVFTLVGVLLVTSFFVRQSVVEGDSMLGTLKNGDNLLISDFMYDPQPGDIVVCEDYSTALRKPIVKRVIATEGQTIRFTADAVYVDGERLDEPYVFTDLPGYKYDVSIPAKIFRIDAEKYKLKYVEYYYYEITVPEGELFVMGDHRNNSTDSRVIGTVTEDSVIGKVLIRFYPFEDFGAVE